MMMNAAFVPGRKMSLCWLISLTSQGFPVSIPEGFNADNSLQNSEENKAKRRAQWKAKREPKVKWSLAHQTEWREAGCSLSSWLFSLTLWFWVWLLFLPSANFVHSLISGPVLHLSIKRIWKISQPRDIISASTYSRIPELKMKSCRLLIAMSISSSR